jgi:hypothetical protein
MADGWPLALLARLFVGVLVCMWFSPRARAPSRRRVVVLPCCRVVVSSGVVASCGSGAAAVAKGGSRGPSLGRSRRKRAPGAQKRELGRRVVVSSARVVGPFLTHLLRSLSLSQDDRCCVLLLGIYYL